MRAPIKNMLMRLFPFIINGESVLKRHLFHSSFSSSLPFLPRPSALPFFLSSRLVGPLESDYLEVAQYETIVYAYMLPPIIAIGKY